MREVGDLGVEMAGGRIGCFGGLELKERGKKDTCSGD